MMRVVKLDYVRLTSNLFIKKFETANGFEVQGVLFNKYMTLLHRNLKVEGYDMHLPHCWYRWGDEVVRYNMPYLSWNHDYSAYTQVSWRGEEPYQKIGHDPVLQYASEFADGFIDRYSGDEGAELAIDEVYSQAPFEFQNDYRKLRESLKNIKSNKTMFMDGTDVAAPLFDSAMKHFPPEFRKMDREKKLFESMFRAMIDGNASSSDLFDITEDFWFYFCYHLRVQKQCHENISTSTMAIWKEKIPEEKELFCLKLQSYAHDFGGFSENDEVLFLRKAWEENDHEFDHLLSKLPDDEKELDGFIRNLRKGGK